jgi:hypothetical protein
MESAAQPEQARLARSVRCEVVSRGKGFARRDTGQMECPVPKPRRRAVSEAMTTSCVHLPGVQRIQGTC